MDSPKTVDCGNCGGECSGELHCDGCGVPLCYICAVPCTVDGINFAVCMSYVGEEHKDWSAPKSLCFYKAVTRLRSTFIDNVLLGRAKPEDIDDYVEKWHTAEPALPMELYEFIGMTTEEWAAWVARPAALEDIIKNRKENCREV